MTWFASLSRSVEYPWLLPLALILPALAVWMLQHTHRQRQARLRRLGNLDVVARLIPPNALKPPGARMARLGAAAALVGIAVAGPRWGAERDIVSSSGIDMVLALDASLSMMAQDAHPSRLEAMKEEVRRLRADSPGDRMGLLAFAGKSYVLSPLTVDEGALDLFLDNLDPSVVGQAGSSIAATIQQGTALLTLSSGGADKALVVMSDGEAFESQDDINAAASAAAQKGIALVTVGFGTTAGANIPIRNPDGSPGLKHDESGQVVVTQYHPETLKAAADAAHGTFIPAEATDKAARVKSALANLRAQARASLAGESLTPRYQYFLFPALLLLLLDTALIERRGRGRRRVAAARSAAAGIALLWGTQGCALFNHVSPAAAAYDAKEYPRAAAMFRDQITAGDADPHTMYNMGTALVAADSLDRAAEALGRVVDSKDPDLHYRALFNLGLVHLKRGLEAPKDQADAPLDSALAAYKSVLLINPLDVDAKWNYELALRKKKSGGGGGGGGSGGGGGGQSPQSQAPQPSGGLGSEQADQLLGSAAREERDVQAQKNKQNRVEPPPGGKDW